MSLGIGLMGACNTPYAAADPPDGGGTSGGPSTVVDSGLASRPGKVECTDELRLCDGTSGQYCCISDDGDGGTDYTCATGDTCSGNRIKCDESADCPSGQMCCANLGLGTFTTLCEMGPCEIAQSCRTDAECTGGNTCIKQSCTGLSGWLCGKNPFCNVE